MPNFRITKTTNWTTSTGKTGVTHSIAYCGRVIVVNPEDFADSTGTFTVSPAKPATTGANPKPATPAMLAIENVKLEIVVSDYEENGVMKKGGRLKPKMDIDVNISGF